MVANPELHLTNFRVWANVPPPFRPKSDISVPVSNDRRTITNPDGDFGIRLRMSTFNRIVVSFGFCMLCASIAVDARGQVPSDQPPPPESQAPEPARAPRERYLMLTSGQLIKGIISETETECLVEQRVGTMHFPKKRVEGAFESIREAYEYRLAQLPDRDTDERMKLALWCMNLKLTAEARELLSSVLKKNPTHAQAKAMLDAMAQTATRLAHRERDPDVRQTKAETMNEEKPEALDSAVLRNAQRGLGINDLPVIFDLPLPLAIRRTEEFTRYVHPVLQAYCVNCHDGKYDGQFQLVPIKNRADRTPNAIRANLDATLRLVDPKNLSHSELLSSTLRPHGHNAKPRPIFPGSNDKAYKILAEWVNHLAAPKEGDAPAAGEASRAQAKSDEVFAVDRNRTSTARPNKAAGATADAGMRAASGHGGGAVTQVPDEPQEFPIPFAISGVKPNPALPKKAAPASQKQVAADARSKGSATITPAKPAVSSDDDDPDDLPDPPKRTTKAGAAKKRAKPVTLDPKLLERALQIRNANRPNPN